MGILNAITDPANEESITGTSYETIGGVLAVILNTMIGVGIAVAVIFMINAGIKFMTARGDPRAAGDAKNALTYSVVALIVAMGAVLVKNLILGVVGGNVDANITNTIPSF